MPFRIQCNNPGVATHSLAASRDIGSDLKSEGETEKEEKKGREKHNAELWDLLKYSQRRLSTGAIPTIAEGESEDLNVDIDNGLSYENNNIPSTSSQRIDYFKEILSDIEEDALSLIDDNHTISSPRTTNITSTDTIHPPSSTTAITTRNTIPPQFSTT